MTNECVNCKQSNNKYVFQFIFHFVVRIIFCATVSSLYNNNYLFVILLYTSVLLTTNNCSIDLYNGNLQPTTVFFTRNFTQGWLNSYYCCLFCLAFLYAPPLVCRECSCSRFIENPIATPLLLAVYSLTSIFFSHADAVVGLLITSSIYVLV